MDINKALRTAISTGEVCIGLRETKKAVTDNRAQLVIVSSNLPDKELKELRREAKVPFYTFTGTNMDLGFACGKPFSIGVLAVIKQGESDVLALRND